VSPGTIESPSSTPCQVPFPLRRLPPPESTDALTFRFPRVRSAVSLPSLHAVQPASNDFAASTGSALNSPIPRIVHSSGVSGGSPGVSPVPALGSTLGYNSMSGLDSDSLPCDYKPQEASDIHECELIILYKNAESWSMSEKAPGNVRLEGHSTQSKAYGTTKDKSLQNLAEASTQSSQTAIRE